MGDEILYSPSGGNILHHATSGHILYSDPSLVAPYKYWINNSQSRSKIQGYLAITNDDDENGDPVPGTRSQVYPAVRYQAVEEVYGTSGSATWNATSNGANAYYSIVTWRHAIYNTSPGDRITAIKIQTNSTYHSRPSGAGRLMVSARVSNSSAYGTVGQREGGTTKDLGSSYNDEWAVDLDALQYLFLSVFVESGQPPTASGAKAESCIYTPSYIMITPA